MPWQKEVVHELKVDQLKAEHKSKEVPPQKNITPNLLRKSVFETKNYYYYFTEIWKEK